MENKIVLITGANGGLGQAFVKAILEKKPKKIYCAARDISTLSSLKEISSFIEILELDITKEESINKASKQIAKLDILINNAGVNSNNRLFDTTFNDIEVNLKGTVNLTKAFFEKIKESKGSVINISSILALINLPLMANYCISKSALHSFTQALRAELKLFEANVYEVFPGPIDTKMSKHLTMPKSDANEIVKEVLKAFANKEYEIYPDEFSKMIKERIQKEKDSLEEEFSQALKQ